MLRKVLILGLAVLVQSLPAQAPPAEELEQTFKLSVTSELVLLDVSVKSINREHVSGLEKGNFKVYEDGKLQTISHFSSEDVPVTAGLVVDASGSMRDKRPDVVAAAIAFLRASNQNDEIFVVHFSDGVKLGLPANIAFTGNLSELLAALWAGTPEGRTALNDAILFSLGHLEKGRRDRRTLLLISDGGDNSSVHKAAEIMQKVLETRTTIYAVGLYDANDQDRNPELLRRLARISGGESFLDVQLPQIDGICRQIASDIRNRYTIGYVPVHTGEQGALRKITVSASSSGGLKLLVHTRTQYVLPPSKEIVGLEPKPGRQRGR